MRVFNEGDRVILHGVVVWVGPSETAVRVDNSLEYEWNGREQISNNIGATVYVETNKLEVEGMNRTICDGSPRVIGATRSDPQYRSRRPPSPAHGGDYVDAVWRIMQSWQEINTGSVDHDLCDDCMAEVLKHWLENRPHKDRDYSVKIIPLHNQNAAPRRSFE